MGLHDKLIESEASPLSCFVSCIYFWLIFSVQVILYLVAIWQFFLLFSTSSFCLRTSKVQVWGGLIYVKLHI